MILNLVEHHTSNNMIPQEMLYRVPESLLRLLIKKADAANKELPTLRSQLRTLQSFKQHLCATIDEYFSAASIDEVSIALKENSLPDFHHEVVRKAISMSLDHGSRERELVSRLLCRLGIDQVLTPEDFHTGFTRLLSSVEDDLQLDCPDAPQQLAKF